MISIVASAYHSSIPTSSIKLSTLIAKKTWSELHDHISSSPRDALIWTNGYLPIHRACWSSAIPHTIIETFVKIYPCSLQQACHVNGDVPLQYAVRCHYSSSEEIINHERIIKALLFYDLQPDKDFQTACFKDKHGHTPLHSYICYHTEPSLNIIQMLLKAYPEAIKVKDNYDWLPLHFASRNNDWRVLDYILRLFPDGLLEKTKFNYTARDLASMFEKIENYKMLKIKEEDLKWSCKRNNRLDIQLNSYARLNPVKKQNMKFIHDNIDELKNGCTNSPKLCSLHSKKSSSGIKLNNKQNKLYP